jgi:hypothetical protein
MHNDMSHDDYEQKGIVGRWKDRFFPSDELVEEYEEEVLPQDTRRRQQLPSRTQGSARVSVAVRLPQSIEDARIAADGLKDGRQQIVNLEKTDQATSERIIDFLSGVTYALNGFVAWILLPGSTPLFGPVRLGHLEPARHICIDLHNFAGLALLPATVMHVWRHMHWIVNTSHVLVKTHFGQRNADSENSPQPHYRSRTEGKADYAGQ